MRYKFRGKLIDNGEWVYGYLIGDDVIVGSVVELNEEYFNCEYWYRVDPETVGQFTGLKDKNGVEIYEGDIASDRYANFYTPIFRNGIYMAYNVQYLHFNAEPSTQFNVVWKYDCEVIGNIHDNPELVNTRSKER